MIRPILRYGAPVLHRGATEVQELTVATQELIDDMIETMYAASGVGLAAPQIGIDQRFFVADASSGRSVDELVVVINPTIVEADGTKHEEEGCLSLPGFTERVVRYSRVIVQGLNRDGQPLRVEGEGLLARIFQHEVDHLDGSLFVNHLHGIKREVIVRRIRKLRRSGKW